MLPVPDVDARRHGSTMNAHALAGWLVMAVLLLAAAASIAVAATGGGDRLLAVSIGDSVAFDADPGIRAALESTGGIRVDTRSFGGVGLLRPGFDGYLAEALRDGPDVVVVMLGGWDLGEILADPDAYGRRLDQVADRMLDRGATVIWLGMPPTPPSEGIEEARGVANGQFEALAGEFPASVEVQRALQDLYREELSEDDKRVRAVVPLHGANLFPDEIPGFADTILEYMACLTDLGHALMRGVAMSLALQRSYFRDRYMADPLTLFRIFHYPPSEPVNSLADDEQWGVGEHTDYGVLTILRQDDVAGLQVKTQSRWIDAPPVANSFVCNIGDMLDRLTRGLYRSTPHRVRNTSGRGRLSFPFFFDPGFDARVEPMDLSGALLPEDDEAERWDQASVHDFEGTYGDYVLSKVSKVFPKLRESVE